MTIVLAAIDAQSVADRVLHTATLLAEVIGAAVEVIHVHETPEDELAVVERFGEGTVRCVVGDPSDRIVEAASAADVDIVVVGARGVAGGARPVGHIARTVLERADRPVAVVPPDDGHRPVGMRRALLPLEGSEVSSSTVGAMAERLMEGGVDIVPLHVFDVTTTPLFWDQAAHAPDSYAASFTQRWSPADEQVRLRRGEAGPTIVDTAHEEGVDLIVLGWSRNLAPGRADVVRTALHDARIPVVLVPSPSAPPDT